jgi:hypothetical protein
MSIDLQPQNIRIEIEKAPGDVLDVSRFLAPGTTVEIGRSEPSADMPIVCMVQFELERAYTDDRTAESWNPKRNARWRPGTLVRIWLWIEEAWREPPFGHRTRIKQALLKDTGSSLKLQIETHCKLSQAIEEDKAFDPERKYDALGNEVPQTRDVLGVVRSLADITNSYLHVKDLGAVINAGTTYLTQQTNASKEYLGDSSDSEINHAQQLVWHNPDRKLELNALYLDNTESMQVAAIPMDTSVTSDRLFTKRWELYTKDLLTYEPDPTGDQLPEFVVVTGIGKYAKARETSWRDAQVPNRGGFSINMPAQPPISRTETIYSLAGLSETLWKFTWTQASAILPPGASGGGFGEVLSDKEITTKYYDGKRRHYRTTTERYNPEAVVSGSGSSMSINQPSYRKETVYTLNNRDEIIDEQSQESAAASVTGVEPPEGTSGGSIAIAPMSSGSTQWSNRGNGIYVQSPFAVAYGSYGQASIPYLPLSNSNSPSSQPPRCEYLPEPYYEESFPLRKKIKLQWDGFTTTGRSRIIDVGGALLSGANFDLLAESLARLEVARFEQWSCGFPIDLAVLEAWTVPGRIASVYDWREDATFHYYTGNDVITISADEIKGSTNLFWIGTTEEVGGIVQDAFPVAIVGRILATRDEKILTTQGGKPIRV